MTVMLKRTRVFEEASLYIFVDDEGNQVNGKAAYEEFYKEPLSLGQRPAWSDTDPEFELTKAHWQFSCQVLLKDEDLNRTGMKVFQEKDSING